MRDALANDNGRNITDILFGSLLKLHCILCAIHSRIVYLSLHKI